MGQKCVVGLMFAARRREESLRCWAVLIANLGSGLPIMGCPLPVRNSLIQHSGGIRDPSPKLCAQGGPVLPGPAQPCQPKFSSRLTRSRGRPLTLFGYPTAPPIARRFCRKLRFGPPRCCGREPICGQVAPMALVKCPRMSDPDLWIFWENASPPRPANSV